MNMKKLIEINDYLRGHAYDLTMVEFLSLIDTTIDEYCAKNELDTNDTWETLNEVRQEVFEEVGEADYMKE